MKYDFKKKLRPYAKGPLRDLFDRIRGLTRTPLTHEQIAAILEKPDPTILEIGCNDGNDTLAFLLAMPKAKIYCFEPDYRAIARFKKLLGSHLDRVQLFEVAVSDRAGRIDFHMSTSDDPSGTGGFDQSGSIRPPKNHLEEHPWVRFESTVTVNTCRLDDWCEEHGVMQVDFIWMDVQGAEGDVIAGAAKTLNKTRFIYTEYSNNELYEGQLSLRSLLKRLPTFELVARYPGDILLKNRNIA